MDPKWIHGFSSIKELKKHKSGEYVQHVQGLESRDHKMEQRMHVLAIIPDMVAKKMRDDFKMSKIAGSSVCNDLMLFIQGKHKDRAGR